VLEREKSVIVDVVRMVGENYRQNIGVTALLDMGMTEMEEYL